MSDSPHPTPRKPFRSRLPAHRSRVHPWVFACAATLLGCSGERDEPSAPSPSEGVAGSNAEPVATVGTGEGASVEPMLDAYAALRAADYDALPDLIARLDAALEQNPGQSRLTLYAATMRLWRATGRPVPLVEKFNDATAAVKLLQRGRELSPDDPQINAFLGIAKMGLANAANNDKQRAEARKILEDAVHLYPPYVNGVLAQALGEVPRDSPHFADAAKAVRGVSEGCGASAEEIASITLRYPEGHKLGTCWNGGIVTHVWEGFFIIAGDIYVKRGDPEAGRRFYANTKRATNYDHWPFKKELEQRIADADQRAALYLDGDLENDPPTWMEEHNVCTGCHADEP